MSFARIGLMGPVPRRPCEDMGVWDAPLASLMAMRRISWIDRRIRNDAWVEIAFF
jgi:hypothetical protein